MKDKLKEINGKYYQECEVVMLATDNAMTNNSQLFLYPDGELLKSPLGNQHLYFLSNEDIKEGDWCIVTKSHKDLLKGDIFQYNGNHSIDSYNVKKIIATTDTSLTIIDYVDCEYPLPQPSKSFIQAYIKAYDESKPITKVLVEMESAFNVPTIYDYKQLKLNSSNEITIKKVKDSWTKEEVNNILEEYRTHLDEYPSVRTSKKYLTNFTEKYL